jgi:hypothetical protein
MRKHNFGGCPGGRHTAGSTSCPLIDHSRAPAGNKKREIGRCARRSPHFVRPRAPVHSGPPSSFSPVRSWNCGESYTTRKACQEA